MIGIIFNILGLLLSQPLCQLIPLLRSFLSNAAEWFSSVYLGLIQLLLFFLLFLNIPRINGHAQIVFAESVDVFVILCYFLSHLCNLFHIPVILLRGVQIDRLVCSILCLL